MRNPDILPRADAEFDVLQAVIVKRTFLRRTAWEIPLNEIEKLKAFQLVWNNAWGKAKSRKTRSSVDVAAKKTARKNYEKPLRRFIQVYIQLNEAMNNEDKISCGIKPHSKQRTRVAVPDTIPFVSFVLVRDRTYDFYYRQSQGEEGSSLRRKPLGIDRLEMVYSIDERPKSADDCKNRCSAKRSPFLLEFPVSAKGKMIYFFVRWVNTRDEAGLWSKVHQFEI